MIEIILTLIVVVVGIISLGRDSLQKVKIRGLENQVQMRDERIADLEHALDQYER